MGNSIKPEYFISIKDIIYNEYNEYYHMIENLEYETIRQRKDFCRNIYIILRKTKHMNRKKIKKILNKWKNQFYGLSELMKTDEYYEINSKNTNCIVKINSFLKEEEEIIYIDIKNLYIINDNPLTNDIILYFFSLGYFVLITGIRYFK